MAQVSAQDSLMKIQLKRENAAIPADSLRKANKTTSLSDTNLTGAALKAGSDTSNKRKPRKRDISTSVTYSCADSMRYDAGKKTFFLYKDSKIDYGDISLKAALIDVNYSTNVVNSTGVPDSTGRNRGIPIFQQGNTKYVSQKIKYNFKTKKGIISEVVTQQGEGYLHGETVKKNPNNEMYVSHAQYTTCNLAHPHFYINAPKLKMIPGDRLITGPFNMVFAGVPTPLGFAFGVFPTPKSQAAGIVVPAYGEAKDLGFFLRGGGYYFPIKDYADVKILGDIYSKGSYGLNVFSNYKVRYKYTGRLSLSYINRKAGEEGLESITENYWLSWSHTPQNYGSSSFSASVNMGSSSYNTRFAQNLSNHLQQSFNSNVSYSKTFTGTPFNFSAAASQNQNVSNGEANFTLPNMSVNMNRIYPFKRANSTSKAWYSQINTAYSLTATNEFSNAKVGPTKIPGNGLSDVVYNAAGDTALGLSQIGTVLKRGKISAHHSIPVSTTITAFKYFNISPSFTFNQTFYTKKYNYSYNRDTYTVHVDTINGLSQFYNYNTSAGVTTRVYGTYFIRKGRLEAIRHTLIPSVSYGYTPDFSDSKYGFFQKVQTDKLIGKPAKMTTVSHWYGLGQEPTSGRSSAMSFSLINQVEAKVKTVTKEETGADTAKATGLNGAPSNTSKPAADAPRKKFEKKMILDNLGLTGSYNFLATNYKLSNLNLTARTKLFNRFDVNMGAVLDPYQYIHEIPEATTANPDKIIPANDPGVRIDRYAWSEGRFSIGTIRSFTINFGTSFNPKAGKKRTYTKRDLSMYTPEQMNYLISNPDLYVDWTIPWNLSMQYNMYYTKNGLSAGKRTQTVNFNGDLSLTTNWKIGASSGYDLEQRQFGLTNINIYRNLHCWEMRVNWIPFGQLQSYTLDINVKASILQDLKLSRRNSWYDR